ncbi:SMP-30/gluconolactonase/LRE family protein [Palleronia sp. LCG004]|uniref:SMP-30/gluconolactonase/LRE family protein n=1 Tax=Palleronia sp. LCG004 TaxID=3079304 RepID=UPI0029429053|nr:SMP-30/gluconolactonase/LRE family protein [Palleronia sp. LCG004]WOI58208.1 SMP-30/gluconolactonase/LRE family protein [Palleronia sp. LCG004]
MTTDQTPRLDMDQVSRLGRGLYRPESVHVLSDDLLAASHRGRGVSLVHADGSVRILGPADPRPGGEELIPNGIAPLPDGGFLIANIGEGGGLWHLSPEGDLTPHLMEVDGVFLSATNFVMTDAAGRLFITVSTVSRPRFAAYTDKVADGLIIVVDDDGPRIIADDICFANECRLTPDGAGLVVAETFSRRITRFDFDGRQLTNRTTVAQFGRGDFPDGIRYDRDGYLWVTCIVANRLWRVSPDGTVDLILEDCDPAHVDTVETALAEGRMGREHFYECGDSLLGNIASIDFSRDGETAYLGSLCGTSLLSFQTRLTKEQ